MKVIKTEILNRIIPINMFDSCLLDHLNRENIIFLYPPKKKPEYYLHKFERHLNQTHNLTFKDYCKNYLNINWPVCPESLDEVGYKFDGRGVRLSMFRRGKINKKNCLAFKNSCEILSQKRIGSGNPMFGKRPWNKDKDKRNPIIKAISDSRKGIVFSQETKDRQSKSAKKRIVHGHTGCKHSLATIKKLRLKTCALWASGRFNRVSSIQIKMREFLQTLNLKENFQEEYQIKYFSMDFAFPKYKVAIECQGTYFHVDPRIYPNGPGDAIQRRNFGRDKVKKKVCEQYEGWKIIPIWETEINDGKFKEILLCKLSELNLLSQ